MNGHKNLWHLIFDLDGVLLDTLPFFNVVCAVMINDALQKMTDQTERQFTNFNEIYNSAEIIGSIFPDKLDWVIRERGLTGLNAKHPFAMAAYTDMRDVADELINGHAHLVGARPQGPSILDALSQKDLLDPQTGQARITPFAGVAEGLQTLMGAGATLGVASTNHQARTEGLLAIAGLSGYFTSVTGTTLKGIEPVIRSKSFETPDVYLVQLGKMTGADDWRSLQGQDLSHVIGIEDSQKGAKAVCGAGMTLVGVCHDTAKFDAEKAVLMDCGARSVAPDFPALVKDLLRYKAC